MLHRSHKRNTLLRATLLAVLLVVFVTPAAAQQVGQAGPVTAVSSLLLVGISGVLTGIVGLLLLSFGYDYTDRTTNRIVDNPLVCLGVGILVQLALAVVVGFLFFLSNLMGTAGLVIVLVVGLVLLPIAITMFIVGQLGFLAVGRAVNSSWAIALVIGAIVSGVLYLVPIAGPIGAVLITSMGIGSAYLERGSSSTTNISEEARGRRDRRYR